MPPRELSAFGHGTADREALTALPHGAGIAAVMDVRIGPGDRRDPGPARTRPARGLPEAGIAHRGERDLGGFRAPPPDSPDTVWRDESFRGCAAHTRTPGSSPRRTPCWNRSPASRPR
jgi:hypothetical protein